jgi:hypothetical protein
VAKPRAASCAWVLRSFRAGRIGSYKGQFRHAYAFLKTILKLKWMFLSVPFKESWVVVASNPLFGI